MVLVAFLFKGTMHSKSPPRQPKKVWCHTRPSTMNYKSFNVSTNKLQCPGRIFNCVMSSGVTYFANISSEWPKGECLPMPVRSKGAHSTHRARGATISASSRTPNPYFEILGASFVANSVGFDASSTLGIWHFWIFTHFRSFPPLFFSF